MISSRSSWRLGLPLLTLVVVILVWCTLIARVVGSVEAALDRFTVDALADPLAML
jgi:hypothetical protein